MRLDGGTDEPAREAAASACLGDRPGIAALITIAAPHAPAHGQDEVRPLTRIAFGSCANQDQPQPIWDAVLAYRPELFMFMGDNVYGDVSLGRDDRAQGRLRQSGGDRGLREARARRCRLLATWDDHDFGRNDAGADFPYKEQAKALFLDFWQVPADDPRRGREGVYSAATFGPAGMRVQVILLDTRSFRSPLRRKPPSACPAPAPTRPIPTRPRPCSAMRSGAGSASSYASRPSCG